MDGQHALTAADATDTTSGLSAGEQNGEQLESQNQQRTKSSSGDKQKRIKAQGPLLCVVPGCTVDVSAGPHYLKRHKICQEHLKARSVEIDGQEVRFCQQCGRFQTLAEFKDDRRSCEAALQAHNARRRVKKDNNPWGTNRRRNNKRTLLSTATDDPSSSEDGAVGASRKVAPRKSSSQRSAPSALQSAAGSDSLRGQGSDAAEKPNLSDGARTVEQGLVWVSNTSPGNSFGSPDGLEQQQQQPSQLQLQLQALQQVQHMSALCTVGSSGESPVTDCEDHQLQQLHALRQQLLPDAGYQQQQAGLATQHMQPAGQAGMWPSTTSKLASGRSRLGRTSGSGLGSSVVPTCCEAPSACMQQQMIQDTLLHSAGMPAANPLQQAMPDASVAVGPSIYGQPGSLAAWIVPPSIAQQQQAQLQQYMAPLGGVGLEEAMGQSFMLQQAMQEQQQQQQQQLMLSQAQMHQQMPVQIQLQQQAVTQQHMLVQQQQQVVLQQQPPVQQQQQHSMLMGSVQSSRGSGTDAGSLSSSVLVLGQDMLGTAAATTAAGVCAPAAAGAAADDMVVATAAQPAGLPATSAAAAAALAGQPVCGIAPLQGCASSSSLGLFDSIDQATAAAAGGPQSADGDEDALLDQALDILLSSGVDWQLDNVLLGTAQDGSVAFSGFTPAPAPTSSPSSSNVNGGNLSGPLSVPSQPSGTSMGMPAAAQQAACPLAASAAAGLAGATDALRIGSPGKVGSSIPAAVAPSAQGSMLAAGGHPPACMPPVLDMSMPPVHDMGPWSGQAGPAGYQLAPPISMAGSFSAAMGGIAYPMGSDMSNCGLSVAAGGAAAAFLGNGQPGVAAGGSMLATGLPGRPAGVPAAQVMGACGGMVATAAMVQAPSPLGGLHAPGFTKMDSSVTGMLGVSPQPPLWQQPQESLLLQQQLTMQQQQQAEYALLQQQQQRQRHEQLMHMQQQIESQRRSSQQLVRLSVKLHGVTPEQLPQHTVQAMERLLTNNAADMETILLQPSLRQGCIQFELDVLVQCPRRLKQQQESLAAVHAEQNAAGTALPGDRHGSSSSSSSEIKAQQQLGAATSAAIVGAINTCCATAAAEACLRQALPFERLVSALLELPLLPSTPAAAGGAFDAPAAAGNSTSGSSQLSGVQEPQRPPAATVHSLATAIYAQVGDHLGIWRADCGLVQDWADQLPEQFVCSSDSSSGGQGLLRPQFQACMPLATATAESSTASSPMAAGLAHMLRPLHLRAVVQPAASSSSSGSSTDSLPVQLWCTRLGQFLPVVVRAAAAPAGASRAGQHAAGEQVDLQVVTGLQDASPGLLLLQVEQQIGRHNSDGNGSGSSGSSTGSSNSAGAAQDEAAVLKCMSGLIPVLLCPSAAMAAEVNAHLLVADDRSSTSQRLLQLGLLLDFWAIQSMQHQHLAAAPLIEWYDALLQNARYLKTVKTVGTQLLLYAVINGMSATAAHLMSIMAVVRGLVSTAAAPVAEVHAAAATAAAAAAGAAAGGTDAAAEPEASNASSSQQQLEGSNAVAAAGLRRVQDWVFEDVDCKSSTSGSSSSSMQNSSGSREAESTGGKALSKSGSGANAAAAAVEARVPESDNQQSPLAMFRGAAQVLAMLVAMYLALEVSAAVYKGYSPAKQLLSSLLHLQQLASVMLVPLVMMCLGAVLAVWQFGLGARRHPQPQQAQQQRNQPGAARTAEGKASITAARAAATAGGQ